MKIVLNVVLYVVNISTCDRYKGNIKGVEKKESIEEYILIDFLKKNMI